MGRMGRIRQWDGNGMPDKSVGRTMAAAVAHGQQQSLPVTVRGIRSLSSTLTFFVEGGGGKYTFF